MRENTIRTIWERGGCVVNGWLSIPDGFAAEVSAHQGWNSLTIDLQHGLVDFQAALQMLQGIQTTATIPLARVPWNDPGIIMKMLDAGCYGIICPMINTRAQCAAFVGACRYAPSGYRSVGPTRAALYAGDDYIAHADAALITIAMIETREAVENLDDILSTPGLDAIYIGPADLSASYGYPARLDPTAPELTALVDHIVASAGTHHIIVGMHTGSAEYALRMQAKGMQFLTLLSDVRLLALATQQTLAAFQGGVEARS